MGMRTEAGVLTLLNQLGRWAIQRGVGAPPLGVSLFSDDDAEKW